MKTILKKRFIEFELCSETQNELAESHEGYENITVLRNITQPDLELLRQIEAITPGDCDGDCTSITTFQHFVFTINFVFVNLLQLLVH
jgi:hypothetical protein